MSTCSTMTNDNLEYIGIYNAWNSAYTPALGGVVPATDLNSCFTLARSVNPNVSYIGFGGVDQNVSGNKRCCYYDTNTNQSPFTYGSSSLTSPSPDGCPSGYTWETMAVYQVSSPTPTLPPVTLPPVTLPPVTLPPVTLPPVTLPPVTLPLVTLPPVTLPPITTYAPTDAPTNSPYTNPPYTNPPYTNPPYTNPPTNPPYTNPPYTNPPYTNPPTNSPYTPITTNAPTISILSTGEIIGIVFAVLIILLVIILSAVFGRKKWLRDHAL
jgi:hypothetical protein